MLIHLHKIEQSHRASVAHIDGSITRHRMGLIKRTNAKVLKSSLSFILTALPFISLHRRGWHWFWFNQRYGQHLRTMNGCAREGGEEKGIFAMPQECQIFFTMAKRRMNFNFEEFPAFHLGRFHFFYVLLWGLFYDRGKIIHLTQTTINHAMHINVALSSLNRSFFFSLHVSRMTGGFVHKLRRMTHDLWVIFITLSSESAGLSATWRTRSVTLMIFPSSSDEISTKTALRPVPACGLIIRRIYAKCRQLTYPRDPSPQATFNFKFCRGLRYPFSELHPSHGNELWTRLELNFCVLSRRTCAEVKLKKTTWSVGVEGVFLLLPAASSGDFCGVHEHLSSLYTYLYVRIQPVERRRMAAMMNGFPSEERAKRQEKDYLLIPKLLLEKLFSAGRWSAQGDVAHVCMEKGAKPQAWGKNKESCGLAESNWIISTH